MHKIKSFSVLQILTI